MAETEEVLFVLVDVVGLVEKDESLWDHSEEFINYQLNQSTEYYNKLILYRKGRQHMLKFYQRYIFQKHYRTDTINSCKIYRNLKQLQCTYV